jgi:aspartate kinase
MIVMKFGGSSVADAERLLGVTEIVRSRLTRQPIVVVSALSGVTDLLERAVDTACAGDLEALDALLATVERRHRWALEGAVERTEQRHALRLEVDRIFDELRQHLRSLRILGERTPRAMDGALAFGEMLSARILAGVMLDRNLPARWVDPREIMVTDERHGAAEPDLRAVRERARPRLTVMAQAGQVPVMGGFVGVTSAGHTTTLGRGGSDTSATVLGLALDAEEIQIWSDVDGLMTADPRQVPTARPLSRISFAEAAELAYYGAKVLHPHAIAPAVAQRIPVRVLNAMRPEAPGTLVLDEEAVSGGEEPIALTSRSDLTLVRATSTGLRVDAAFPMRVLAACSRLGLTPDAVVCSGLALALVVPSGSDGVALAREIGEQVHVESRTGCALLCVVGARAMASGSARERLLSALAPWRPQLVAIGASRISLAAVLDEDQLAQAMTALHRSCFEEQPA